ncbi:hypothetical protein AS222_06515 [Enterococcus faecium]|nr:hypothetical protein AS222_06515 [Enterococcus faecium]
MSDVRVDAMQEKLDLIDKLDDVTVFINNNQQSINPTNLAEVLDQISKLEEKAKQAFYQDEHFDPIIYQLIEETERQDKLINNLSNRINSGSEELSDSDDEYKGVIIEDV